jgi:hypothetical protein
MFPEVQESYYRSLKRVVAMGVLLNERDGQGMMALESFLRRSILVLAEDVPNRGLIDASLTLIDLGAYVTDTVLSGLLPVTAATYIKHYLQSINERGEEGTIGSFSSTCWLKMSTD